VPGCPAILACDRNVGNHYGSHRTFKPGYEDKDVGSRDLPGRQWQRDRTAVGPRGLLPLRLCRSGESAIPTARSGYCFHPKRRIQDRFRAHCRVHGRLDREPAQTPWEVH
jgi:hypothetical protein